MHIGPVQTWYLGTKMDVVHIDTRYPSTTSATSARAPRPNLYSGSNKRLCSDWYPCRGTKSERGLS